jgi:DNA-binding MarR family transcriptional regulator
MDYDGGPAAGRREDHHLERRSMTASEADDPRVAEALTALRQIVHSLHRASRSAERAHGVSGAQLFVLQLLADAPAHSLNALAERTLTHQSSVSVVVSRLVARGLVERSRSPEDGRRIELRLSAEGEELLTQTPAAMQIRLIESLRALPGRDLRTLAGLLTQVVHSMGAADESTGFLFDEAEP